MPESDFPKTCPGRKKPNWKKRGRSTYNGTMKLSIQIPETCLDINIDDTGLLHHITFSQTSTVASGKHADDVIHILNEAMKRKSRILWQRLNLSAVTPFQLAVYKSLVAIPYGETRSYQEIAESIGSPKASRAVGTALAKNPFPLIFPCHRVIRTDGSIGQFQGGTALKKKLIERETKN
ncbi:MAG: O-6-methylguanine DNA methyltransferase [Candidatus Marinamargulisbacteria bacterium]|jgi:O-6-methylguanine DNA methyltransferase